MDARTVNRGRREAPARATAVSRRRHRSVPLKARCGGWSMDNWFRISFSSQAHGGGGGRGSGGAFRQVRPPPLSDMGEGFCVSFRIRTLFRDRKQRVGCICSLRRHASPPCTETRICIAYTMCCQQQFSLCVFLLSVNSSSFMSFTLAKVYKFIYIFFKNCNIF